MKDRILPGLDLEVGDTIMWLEYVNYPRERIFPSLVLSISGPYEVFKDNTGSGKYLSLLVVTEKGVQNRIFHENYFHAYTIVR